MSARSTGKELFPDSATVRRTALLADTYDAVVGHLDEAIAAYEAGDKAGFDAGMRRVMGAMGRAGEVIVSGPLLPPTVISEACNNVIRLPTSPAQCAAARQRRWRRRQACGEVVVTVTVPQREVVDALIATRRLSEPETLDRNKVAHAVGEVVVDWARQWSRGAKIP